VHTGSINDMIYHLEESEGKYRFDLSVACPLPRLAGSVRHDAVSPRPQHPRVFRDHVVIHTGDRTVLNHSMAGLIKVPLARATDHGVRRPHQVHREGARCVGERPLCHGGDRQDVCPRLLHRPAWETNALHKLASESLLRRDALVATLGVWDLPGYARQQQGDVLQPRGQHQARPLLAASRHLQLRAIYSKLGDYLSPYTGINLTFTRRMSIDQITARGTLCWRTAALP